MHKAHFLPIASTGGAPTTSWSLEESEALKQVIIQGWFKVRKLRSESAQNTSVDV